LIPEIANHEGGDSIEKKQNGREGKLVLGRLLKRGGGQGKPSQTDSKLATRGWWENRQVKENQGGPGSGGLQGRIRK